MKICLHTGRAAVAALWVACGTPHPAPEPPPASTSEPSPPVADAGPVAVGVVGEAVRLDGSRSVGDSFEWRFDDGTTQSGAVVEKVFAAPGNHTADLVVAADGSTATDSVRVVVTWPLVDPTSLVAASSMGASLERLYVALRDQDAVAVVSLSDTSVEYWPTCALPIGVAPTESGVVVACEHDAVWRHDAGGALLWEARLRWGARPVAVAVDGDRVLVASRGDGRLTALDLGSGELLASRPTASDAGGLGGAGGRWFVPRWRSPDDGGSVAVHADDLELDAVATLPLDLGPDSDTNSRGVPTLLARVAPRPDGRVAALPGSKQNLARGLARDGLPLTFETTARADLRLVSLDAAEGPVGEQVAAAVFDDRDHASAAAWSPLGEWLFVAHSGMETVDVLDGFTLRRVGAAIDAGSGVEALWVSPDGAKLYTFAANSRELVVFDLANVAVPAWVDRIELLAPGLDRLSPEERLGREIFGRSVDPRMCTGGYLSCASCHPGGESDGRTWDFTDRGEGLRDTISLVGHRGTAQGPLHWSANFDEIADFEHDIRGPQAGAGFLDDAAFLATSPSLGPPKAGLSAELDAIEAWLGSLDDFGRSPFRTPEGALTSDAELGQSLFLSEAVGCGVCHPPPEYTDSSWVGPVLPLLHDVGTLTALSGSRLGGPLVGLDTPTLRGLFATGPWLHDGSASALRDVLVAFNPDDRHGATSQLTDAEIDALVAFLLQIE